MDLDLSGKTALISGSTSGIGFATGEGLAKMGAEVVLNGRNQQRLSEAVERIKKVAPNASVRGIAADLSSEEGIKSLIEQLPKVDILVNNLGMFEPKEFQDIPDGDWHRLFETNVMSGVRLSKHYMPAMLENKWGRIVFVSSEAALNVEHQIIHYSVTKVAQLALARGLAHLTKGTGVTVNSVLPGPTNSEGVAVYMRDLAIKQGIEPSDIEKQFFKSELPWSTHQRWLTVSEVSNAILYLCSKASSATNGACVRCDGGALQQMVP